MIVLRDYQEQARDAALAVMEQPPDAGATFLHQAGAARQAALIAMATGSGKTEVAFGVLEALFQSGAARRALLISHTTELVEQPVERILRDWPTLPPPGVVKAARNEAGAPIVSASIQTLSANGRMDRLLANGAFDACFYDECHRIMARTPRAALEKLYRANLNMRLLGASATPHRSDGQGVGRVFGSKAAYKITIKDAIQKLECIAPFDAYAARLDRGEHDFSNVRTNAVGDYAPGETGRILSLESALEIIVDKWLEKAADRPTIAFTASVQQAHDLAAAFDGVGVQAEAIDGATPKKRRAELIEAYRRGDFQVLCGCAVFVEGFDAPRASCALIARPTQHDGSYIQMLGRALRWLDKDARLADDAGHDRAVIIDVVPKGARDLVMAKSILGPPLAVKRAEERAEEEGVADALAFPLPKFGGGIDADSDEVYLEILDLFAASPLAWFTDGRVSSLPVGTTEDKFKQSVSLAIVQNGGHQVWRLKIPKWIPDPETPRGWRKLPGGAKLLGRFGDFEAANDAALAYIDERGADILNNRRKSWRRAEPTPGQEKKARKLGVWREGLTRGQVSTLINHAEALNAIRKLEKMGRI